MLLLAGLWLSKGQIRNHSYSTEDRCSWRQNEEGWFRSQTPPLATSLPPTAPPEVALGPWPQGSMYVTPLTRVMVLGIHLSPPLGKPKLVGKTVPSLCSPSRLSKSLRQERMVPIFQEEQKQDRGPAPRQHGVLGQLHLALSVV